MFDKNPILKRLTLQIWAWRTLDKVQGRCCHLGSRALLRKILAAQRLSSDEWFTKWALHKSSSKAHISDVAAAIHASLIFFRPRSISSLALLDVTRERRASWLISLIIPLSEAMIMDTQGRNKTCDWRLILWWYHKLNLLGSKLITQRTWSSVKSPMIRMEQSSTTFTW